MARPPRRPEGSGPMRLRVVLELVTTAAVCAGLGAPTARAAELIVVDGLLYGATNVQVGSSLYNVLFKSGSCTELFNGCFNSSSFTFGTADSAAVAAQALLDQVFVDSPLGAFDSDPSKTNGVSGLSVGEFALIGTPFRVDFPVDAVVHIAMAVNCPAGPCNHYGVDAVDTTWGHNIQASFTNSPYAVWSPVPEPSTGLLLGAGLAVLAAARRRRRALESASS